MINATLTSNRLDLLNAHYKYVVICNLESTKSVSDLSILSDLCRRSNGVEVEALAIRSYHWLPAIRRFVESGLLTDSENGFVGIDVFSENARQISISYEEHINRKGECLKRLITSNNTDYLPAGDYDERVFTAGNADRRIGTPQYLQAPAPLSFGYSNGPAISSLNLIRPSIGSLRAGSAIGGMSTSTALHLVHLSPTVRPLGMSDSLVLMLDKTEQKNSVSS